MKRTTFLGVLLATALAAPAAAQDDKLPDASAGPTYHRDIEPILQRRCQKCHRPGAIGPFALLGFALLGAHLLAQLGLRYTPW